MKAKSQQVALYISTNNSKVYAENQSTHNSPIRTEGEELGALTCPTLRLTKHHCDKDRTVPTKEEINRLREESREPRNRSHTYTQQIISKGTNAIE